MNGLVITIKLNAYHNALLNDEIPRRYFSRRVMRCIAFLVIVQPVICVVLFSALMKKSSIELRQDSSRALNHLISDAIADQVENGWSGRDAELLNGLRLDPTVMFACVIDGEGQLLHASVFEQSAYERFQQVYPGFGKRGPVKVPLDEEQPVGDDLLVRRFAIEGGGGATVGSLVLATSDTRYQSMIRSYHAAQILTLIGVAVILLPALGILIHHWTKPLNHLLGAIRRLANGQRPEPIDTGDRGEFGYLSHAFNAMAGRLMASQNELREANRNLEEKVRTRTNELRKLNVEFRRLASTDMLTGLANRRVFNETLNSTFGGYQTGGWDFICVMIDLDGFKGVNDALGHDAGDDILKIAAQVVGDTARSSDLAARFGGDEFALIMQDITLDEVISLIQAMCRRFSELGREFFAERQYNGTLSMSAGVASSKTHGADRAHTLLTQADTALYQAKRTGKARVEVYSPHAAA